MNMLCLMLLTLRHVYSGGAKPKIQENIDLNECQSPVNWELVNIKYLVFLVLLLHYRHV